MIYSMTGFGKATANYKSKDIYIEIRSLNSKFMDLNIKCPMLYREKEMDMRKYITENLLRGKAELSINVVNKLGDEIVIDESLITTVYETLSKLNIKLSKGIPNNSLSIESLLNIPNVIKPSEDSLTNVEWKGVSKAIKEATVALIAFRKQEGEQLMKDLHQRIANIKKLQKSVLKYVPKRAKQQKEKLQTAIQNNKNVDLDENRLEQEYIYYIEKLDLTEEIVRLDAHCTYFLKELKNKEVVKGKKLGFISQEMGREINTIGSKANYAEIQQLVVEMKDELEKIKEQLSNIL